VRNAILAFLCSSLLAVSGCVTLSPELVRELAKDDASFCASADVRGGAGGIVGGATGGYGQGTLRLCRSNKDNAKMSIAPDGTMSIQNGEVKSGE
jgi:hypothetical protein